MGAGTRHHRRGLLVDILHMGFIRGVVVVRGLIWGWLGIF